MDGSSRLTDAEIAFIRARVLEGFHLDEPGHPARESYLRLGLSREDVFKDHEFECLWQEQAWIEIFTEAGQAITVEPAPCPWPDAATFLRRWDEILPEVMARCFEQDLDPDQYKRRTAIRPLIWGEVEINPFTDGEAEFLDALAVEVRSRTFGPCLRAVVARGIHHFHTLSLIERRWFEATERGEAWPLPHRPDPPCPWQGRRAFADRFDRELNPNCHYAMTESWKARLRRPTPDQDVAEPGLHPG